MALTVDYSTVAPWLITVPKADLTLDTGTQYKLTVDEFWSLLSDFSDNENVMAKPVLYSRIPATSSTPSITEIDLTYYQIEFEDGLYSVNIINGNTNIREAEVKNQVSVNTNNTTGFIDPTFLEHSTFGGHIVVYNGGPNSISGTEYPAGTLAAPSNNMADALAIAVARGIDTFLFKANMTLFEDYSAGYSFVGGSPFHVITCDPTADMTGCSFNNLTVQGEVDGLNTVRDCNLLTISGLSGFIEKCALGSTVGLIGDTFLVECYSNVQGSGHPDLTATAGVIMKVRDFHGSLGIHGVVDGSHSIGIDGGGRVIVDTDCTGGTVHLRGQPFEIVDNSAVGCTVVNETESSKVTAIKKTTDLNLKLVY